MTEQDMMDMYEEAHTHLEEGDLEKALESARLLLAADDTNHAFWCFEGQIRLALNEQKPAERAFDRACSLAPGLPEPLFHKANYHMVLEQYDEAYRLTEQALQYAEDDEDRFNAHFLLGESQQGHAQALIIDWLEDVFELEDQALPPGALSSLDDIEMPPLPPEIVALLEKSMGAADKALAIRDDIAEGWDLKARCHLALNEPEPAIDAWKKAIELEPYDPLFWHHLATTHLDLEEFEEAEQAFREVYKLEIDDPEGLELSRAEFEEIATQACQDLEAELHDHLETPLVLRAIIEDFPDEEYMDAASADEPFDPWIPCLLSTPMDADENQHQTIEFILFQRNVEREAGIDDPHMLYHFIHELMTEVFQQLFAHLEEEEPIEA